MRYGRFRLSGLMFLVIIGELSGCHDNDDGAREAPPAPVTITTAAVSDGVTGQAYDQTLQATGGTGGLTWSVSSGTPPDGLGLSAGGVISGTPTTTGTFDFAVQASDSASPAQTDTQALTIRVADPLAITTAAFDNGTDGVAYEQTVLTTGGLAPLAFDISSGALPAGVVLDAATGTISGTPTVGGAFNFTVRALDSLNARQEIAQDYALLILKIITSSLPGGAEGQAYTESLSVTGQVDPVLWRIAAGSLPMGLNLDANSGEISGTPTETGSFDFSVEVTDSDSPARIDTQALSITISQALPPMAGTFEMVSVDSNETLGNAGSSSPRASADGRYVAFGSNANNLVPGDTNGAGDVFVRDRQAGETVRVSVASDGTQANDFSFQHSISADGRFVAFQSVATNLVADDTNGVNDVFVHDRDADNDGIFDEPGAIATVRVSVASDGSEGNAFAQFPSISADGRFVAFQSDASNLVANDTTLRDVFVHDRDADGNGIFDETCDGCRSTVRVSVAGDGSEANDSSEGSSSPYISADGRFVAFKSFASNLVADDFNFEKDVFVHDRDADGNGIFDETCDGCRSTVVVTVASDGTQANFDTEVFTISLDGRFVGLDSFASNLVADDTNGLSDVFVHDRDADRDGVFDEPGAIATVRVSVASDGSQSTTGSGGGPVLSGDGRFVAFGSAASDLVAGDTNGLNDIFLHDRDADGNGVFDDTCNGCRSTIRVSVASDGTESNGVSTGPFIPGGTNSIVFFQSTASNLAAGDTNNATDVFVAGTGQ